MAKAAKPEYTEEQLEVASAGWAHFAVLVKWSCVGITVLLAGMAAFLL